MTRISALHAEQPVFEEPAKLNAERPTGHAAEAAPMPESTWSHAFTRVGRDIDQGESLIRRAENGGLPDYDPATLIALQAGIYRYTEAVDLVAKIVDRGGGALRTVLEGGGR
jgi:hypothetical protein